MNKTITDINNPDLKATDSLSGYTIIRRVYCKEIEAFFYEIEHVSTGAKHIHISCADTDNTFSVAFKTVPYDSTGVAHILEHTALCGSTKFPVRDPFFSMINRSLNTFMNAFTASDWTMYPFSTQNKKDYFNLMDVYLDAAFFPKLDELSFKQEGHRLELNEKEMLDYKGVVYNEMKGAMSSPGQIMGRSLLKALYPTTTYGWNSGGDPAIIPELTWHQLNDFHKKHYHPSNAFFYTYGNLPLKESLHFIEEKILTGFKRIDPKTNVPREPRWETPKKVLDHYPLEKNESTLKKSQVCVGWLTADINDSFEVLTLSLLSHVLIGNSASPLRKALIDSKLGSALCDASGFDSDNRDTMFACGLKDVDENDASEIESIIFRTLSELAENGIDRELIDSAIHQTEFRRKEVTNSPYPYGIKLLMGISGNWFHGGDPARVLQLDEDLKQLQNERAKGNFFENKIRTYFLDNNHRVLFTLAPDQNLEEKENIRVIKELEKTKNRLSELDIKKIKADTEALVNLQESKEDLSCLPTLKLSDIPSDIKIIKKSSGYNSIPAACYKQPTSGIFYFVSAAGINKVPEHLLPLIPFFCSAFTKMGTKDRDYAGLARLISATTGGIGLSVSARTSYGSPSGCLPFIAYGGKSLNRNQNQLFDLIQECALKYDFSDTERLKSLLFEYRAGIESGVVQNGHALAISLSTRNFSSTCYLNELWHGVGQLKMIKELTDNLKEPQKSKGALSALVEDLSQVARGIFTNDNFHFALIGEDEIISAAKQGVTPLADHFGKLSDLGLPLSGIDKTGPETYLREGWSTNSAVSFVSSSLEVVPMSHRDAPSLAVISKILRSKFLHREIREKGGAYGGFSIYNSEDGIFSFGSYRDPHICNTLHVYEEAGNFLKSGAYTEEDVTEAILQVCSAIDKPDTPGPAARKAFYRTIIELSDEARMNYKKQLLGVKKKDIADIAEKYFNPETCKMSVAVISGEDKLIAANKKLKDRPLSIHKI